MVGRSGGVLGGRERIVVVDELLPGRLKWASRRHVLRRRQTWRPPLVVALVLFVLLVAPDLLAGEAISLPLATVLGGPVVVLMTAAIVVLWSQVSVGRHIDTEVVPGRLIGLSIGSHTIRYRDHDSCVEYAYSCVSSVQLLRDVVVVDLGRDFWVVPIELFDGVSLEVLRTRAGSPALHGELWPELVA
jgi:hypothetical protein